MTSLLLLKELRLAENPIPYKKNSSVAKPSFAILLSEKLSDRSNRDLILIECDIVTVFVIFCPRLLRYGVVE